MEIPIFNRIRQLDYIYRDLSKIQLDNVDLSKMRELERISVSQYGKIRVDDADLEATVNEVVPPCRLESVRKAKNKISITLRTGSNLACCSQ